MINHDVLKIVKELPNVSYHDKMFYLDYLANDPSVTQEDRVFFYNKLDKETDYWARIFMGHVVQEVPDFHEEIYNGLDDLSLSKHMLYFAGILFRGAAKSTIKNIFVTKSACHQHHPFILMVSETEDQAVLDLRSIVDELEGNELIKYFYFNNKVPKGSIWNAGYIELSNGVAIMAKGMNSRMRGFKHKNQRPTLVLLDDFESRTNLATEEMRKQVNDTIDAVILPIGDVGCKFVFLNTIVSPLAYMQKAVELASENKGIFSRPHGRLVRYDITYDDGTGKQIPTWEKRYSLDWIASKRRYYEDKDSLATFYQEYYNVPKEESAPMLNTELIQPVKAKFGKCKYVKYLEIDKRKIAINVFLGVDPAVRTREHNDDTCIAVIGVDMRNNVYLLDIFAGKIQEVLKPAKILEYAGAYSMDRGVIETYGYQFSLYEWTTKAMLDSGEYYSFVEFNNGQSKKQKYLEGIDPVVNSGKLSYIEDCPNVDLLKNQMRKFSGGKRTHDDLIDGLFLALLHSYPPSCDDDYVEELIQQSLKEEAESDNDDNYETNWRTA